MSVASLWEMAIKISLGKLEVAGPLSEFVQDKLAMSGIALLNITDRHAYAIATLPFHHRDPFDRMLVAQCVTEGLTVVSSDSAFEAYGIHRVW